MMTKRETDEYLYHYLWRKVGNEYVQIVYDTPERLEAEIEKLKVIRTYQERKAAIINQPSDLFAETKAKIREIENRE
jgi:hypothetical protein